MINKIDLRKAISSIAISNAKRNTIYRAFSDLDSITKEEFDSVKSDISKVVESMLTKDTVGKANGVASLDSNGSVPIEQLGNIDTTLFLIVRELPTTDIQSNKIYLVPNQNGKGDNVYLEYLYIESVWEKLGEFKPEVDLSHIEAKLDTKADITDVNNRLDDLQNYCFKLGPDERISTPFNNNIFSFGNKIQQLNNNEEYTYADISELLSTDKPQYIYDKTLNKTIKVIKISEGSAIDGGDFFRTAEPLDLTHTLYLDNEKTGIIENLTQLTIEDSNVFVNIPYVEVDDNLEDDEAPQYIYDATDSNWIKIVETYYVGGYYPFNTEEPLDLTHELYYSDDSNLSIKWTSVKPYSIALGVNASANSSDSIAIGKGASVNKYNSIALGNNSLANGAHSAAIGDSSSVNGNQSIAIGKGASVNGEFSIALGYNAITNMDNSIALGNTTIKNINSIALGNYGLIRGDCSIALGNNTVSDGQSVALGYKANASYNATALGYNANANPDSIALGYKAHANINNCIVIGNQSTSSDMSCIVIGDNNIANKNGTTIIGYNCKSDFYNNLLIGKNITAKAADSIIIGNNIELSKLACLSLNISGIAFMEMDRDNYGLYLKDFGGYDGTNLVVKSGNTETLNPNIKSVQQIINEKANASAIPTKVSQLTNDANFITSYTETDPVWTREKTNYYTKTEIDNKGYLTAHQSLDAYAEKKELDDVKNSIRDYVDSTLNSYVTLNDISILLSGKADLADDKLKAEQLPKLFNITTAATTEEVVTKFNELLNYLKAKGYMEADTVK